MASSESSCDPPEVSRVSQGDNISKGYEYLDHPADIQIHASGVLVIAGGDTIAGAYEQAAVAMFGYMTDLEIVEEAHSESIVAEGHDLQSLLFHFLDEFLFLFSAEPYFIPKRITIREFDCKAFKISAEGYGETFDLAKHSQGTEVKAITYSNMQVHNTDSSHEVYVIVDI